jgi:rRNA-processing protein FCF1
MLLKPGKTCDEGITFFEDMQWGGLNDCQNAIPPLNAPDFAQKMSIAMLRYTEWTAAAVKQIREVVDDPAIAARMRGETYWIILGSAPASPRTGSMLHAELQELSTFFVDCANELRAQKERFRGHSGRSLVLDTNDFLHYQRFDRIPWTRLYGRSTRIVIPHVVVDEIDAKSYSEGEKFAKRARGVYRVLEGYLDHIDASGFATLPDGATLEILADEPGHRRVENNDDEIVARAAFLQQAIWPNTITVITRDIGMRTRARTRRLKAEKLDDKYLIPQDDLSASDLDAAVAGIEPAPSVPDQEKPVE